MTQQNDRDDDVPAEAIRDLSGDAPRPVGDAERRKAIRKLKARLSKTSR